MAVEHKFAEVAIPLPLRRTFTYHIPVGMRSQMLAGARVSVPFGKRYLTGYAVEFHQHLDPATELQEADIKDIVELLDEEPLITSEILELTRWAADYYLVSWGEMLKAALPAGINSLTERLVSITAEGGRELERPARNSIRRDVLHHLQDAGSTLQADLERSFGKDAARRALNSLSRDLFVSFSQVRHAPKTKAKRQRSVALLDENADDKPLNPQQLRILEALKAADGEMLFTDLMQQAEIAASPINTLAKRGYLSVEIAEVFRDPLKNEEIPTAPEFELSPAQVSVLSEITAGLGSGFNAFLLHGVTGSGKTEVYIRAMRQALDNGRSALMLVPEIALTPIFSRRLRSVFGSEVAILHSNLSAGERFDEWRNLYRGRARVAIGTRSAVFAPLRDLGLVIIDEEHDPSYRQHESPFYNGRDLAVMRSNLAKATAVLGSATPALETFQNAKSGKYRYLRLPERIGGRPLATAEVIDMREVFRSAGKDVTISPELASAIEATRARGEQSIILLNRRGFSQFVMCRSCGETLRCKNCDISMTYHRGERRLTCHYCLHTTGVPDVCPFCESEFLYFVGEGTEQLESSLMNRFPGLRVARVDRDTMSRRGEMSKTLLAFDKGELDMLVGTQMLAKGHDFHNVTLVGVISVDTGLGMPDFRAAERTFQLLTQVAGRAGRGKLAGRVLIQTYHPEHYAIRHAAKQDFEGFFAEELRFRRLMSYPPFVVLASVLVHHEDRRYAYQQAELFRTSLERANSDRSSRVYGVAPASLPKLRNEFRLQILIKSASRKKLRAMIDIALADAAAAGCDLRIINVEIDPINVM